MFAFVFRLISSKKFICNEVLGLLFADPYSEGECLPPEDDGDAFSDDASDASLPCSDAAGQSDYLALHQAQSLDHLAKVDTHLLNVSDGNSVSWGGNVYQGVSRRVSSVGNEAGSEVGVQCFYCASHVANLFSDCTFP